MFERKQYKKQALSQLKGNYRTSFLIVGIVLFFTILSNITVFGFVFPTLDFSLTTHDYEAQVTLMQNIASKSIFIGSIFFVLFVVVLTAGTNFFYAISNDKKVSINTFFEGFSLWAKGILGYLWAMLWVVLWMLLFYIPGIVKLFAYSQLLFIIADNPKVGIRRALRMSIEMTKGYKGDLFFMHLSFFGWYILLGLPGIITQHIFFGGMYTTGNISTMNDVLLSLIPSLISMCFGSILVPYYATSFSNAYKALKKAAIDRKALSPEDFGDKESIQTIEG